MHGHGVAHARDGRWGRRTRGGSRLRVASVVVIVGLVAMLLPSLSAQAGTGAWSTTGPTGGVVTAVASDPNASATVFMGTDNWGMYRSTNKGGTWTRLVAGLSAGGRDIYAIAFNKNTSPSTVLIGTDDGVWKMPANGTTWTRAGLPGLEVFDIAVSPQSASQLTWYVATNETGGVYKTTNGGTLWTLINKGLPTNPDADRIAVDPGNALVVYLAGYNGVFRTTNASSWTVIRPNVIPISTTINDITPVPGGTYPSTTLYLSTDGGVFKSTNSGTAWASFNSGVVDQFTSINTLVVDPTTPTTVYAGDEGSNAVYVNKTGTWADYSGSLPLFSTRRRLGPSGTMLQAAPASGAGPLQASCCTSPVLSARDQLSQMDKAGKQPLYRYGAGAISGLAFSGAYLVSGLGFGKGVYRTLLSSPSGAWVASNGGFYHVPVSAVTRYPSGSAATTNVIIGTGAGVFRSTNNGGSWTAFNAGLPSYLTGYVTAFAVDGSNVYAGLLFGGIYKSASGGSWTLLSGSSSLFDVMDIAVAPGGSTIYVAAGYGGFFRSTNSGTTFAASTTGLPWGCGAIYAVAYQPGTPANVLIGTAKGVWKSTNSGASWTLASTGIASAATASIYKLLFTNATTVYAGWDNGVYKGAIGVGFVPTWVNSSPAPLSGNTITSLAYNPGAISTVWAGSPDGGGVFKTTTSGGSWIAENTSLADKDVNGIAFNPGSTPTTGTLHAATSNASEQDYTNA